MSASASARSQSKRTRSAEGEEDKENSLSAPSLPLVKKQRVNPAPPAPKDLYKTLPEPTDQYIQLRFQLKGQRGVYRSVQLPLNYTFAHLHTVCQYIFGWSGKGAHRARAYTNVETYKLGSVKEGCIKKMGEAPELPDDLDEAVRPIFEAQHEDAAIYEVVPVGQSTNEPSDYSYHYKVNDHQLELSEVWNEDEDQNLSRGESINDTIGVIYEYGAWSVHITLDWLCTIDSTSNDMFVIIAKGAPVIEERSHWSPDDPQASEKTVSSWLFDPSNFLRYCQNKIGSRVLADSLSITLFKRRDKSEEWMKAKREQIVVDAHKMRMKYEKSEKEYRKDIRSWRKTELEQRAIHERTSRKDLECATLMLMTSFMMASTAALTSRRY